ncbi:AAA family ATPase [Myxococcota bacterium]
MSIITISRGSHSMGKTVAERVASRLGYECLSRDVLLEASDRFNVPEIKLQKAIHDSPSILERYTHGKQTYIAFIQSALTGHVSKDNVVYHGLAGHLLLKNVSHVLKVRIIASLDLRVKIVMERERCGQQEAASSISKLDNERRKWTRNLFHVDPWDPTLYDLMLNLPRYTVDDAVDLISRSAELKQFQTTVESQQEMDDLALASQIKAAVVEKHPEISVACRYGNVLVYCAAGDRHERKVKASLDQMSTAGIHNVEIHAGVSPPANAV